MMRYQELMKKEVRVITMVFLKNGRKIKTDYFGVLVKNNEEEIIIMEFDNKFVHIKKRHIKRIEEYSMEVVV